MWEESKKWRFPRRHKKANKNNVSTRGLCRKTESNSVVLKNAGDARSLAQKEPEQSTQGCIKMVLVWNSKIWTIKEYLGSEGSCVTSGIIFWVEKPFTKKIPNNYALGPKGFKLWKVPAVVGSIVVVGALTRCALLQSVYDVKAVQMNVLSSLIREFMLYEFELAHYAAEATTNICCTKCEDTIDYSTLSKL